MIETQDIVEKTIVLRPQRNRDRFIPLQIEKERNESMYRYYYHSKLEEWIEPFVSIENFEVRYAYIGRERRKFARR